MDHEYEKLLAAAAGTTQVLKHSFSKGNSEKNIEGLDKEAFNQDMAGIRPKIKGEVTKDFVIKHEIDRGMVGFINLIGIESPGLTASLSIAKYVKNIANREP